MKITSSAFKDTMTIPKKYTCEGLNINPALAITEIPPAAKSLALIMDDPDAPGGTFNHWLLWNIPLEQATIAEATTPSSAVVGKNSAGSNKYLGPCPPSGTHHYRFTAFALDSTLSLGAEANRAKLDEALKNHVIDQATLTGLYQKENQ